MTSAIATPAARFITDFGPVLEATGATVAAIDDSHVQVTPQAGELEALRSLVKDAVDGTQLVFPTRDAGTPRPLGPAGAVDTILEQRIGTADANVVRRAVELLIDMPDVHGINYGMPPELDVKVLVEPAQGAKVSALLRDTIGSIPLLVEARDIGVEYE